MKSLYSLLFGLTLFTMIGCGSPAPDDTPVENDAADAELSPDDETSERELE